jgi:hypothetical protein
MPLNTAVDNPYDKYLFSILTVLLMNIILSNISNLVFNQENACLDYCVFVDLYWCMDNISVFSAIV